MCVAWGDPHYDTFDGITIDYMGFGPYIMTARRPSCVQLQDFLVVGEHEERNNNPDLSYMKWVELHVFLPTTTTRVKLGKLRKIWVIIKLLIIL